MANVGQNFSRSISNFPGFFFKFRKKLKAKKTQGQKNSSRKKTPANFRKTQAEKDLKQIFKKLK